MGMAQFFLGFAPMAQVCFLLFFLVVAKWASVNMSFIFSGVSPGQRVLIHSGRSTLKIGVWVVLIWPGVGWGGGMDWSRGR